MWVLVWKRYGAGNMSATVVSFIGALMRYAGVMCLFSSLIAGGLICLGIGIGLHFLADHMAESKRAKRVQNVQRVVPAAANAAPVNPMPTAQAARPVSRPVQAAQNQAYVPAQAPAQTPVQPAAASGMPRKRCPHCGTMVIANSKFCNKCGKVLQRVRKCLRCGEIVEDGSAFCRHCGYPVK